MPARSLTSSREHCTGGKKGDKPSFLWKPRTLLIGNITEAKRLYLLLILIALNLIMKLIKTKDIHRKAVPQHQDGACLASRESDGMDKLCFMKICFCHEWRNLLSLRDKKENRTLVFPYRKYNYQPHAEKSRVYVNKSINWHKSLQKDWHGLLLHAAWRTASFWVFWNSAPTS